jgi:polo-like kinase 1
VDVWSVGVVVFTMLFGKPPYETPDVKQTYKRIKNNEYMFPDNIPCSEAARDLIEGILKLDPSQRYTLDEILEHEWLTSE